MLLPALELYKLTLASLDLRHVFRQRHTFVARLQR